MFMKQKQRIIFMVHNISPQKKAGHSEEFSYSQDAFWCWLFGNTKLLQHRGSHFVTDWLFPSCLWVFITSLASLPCFPFRIPEATIGEKSLILAYKAARFQGDFVVGVFFFRRYCVSAFRKGLETLWMFSIPCYSSNVFALYSCDHIMVFLFKTTGH